MTSIVGSHDRDQTMASIEACSCQLTKQDKSEIVEHLEGESKYESLVEIRRLLDDRHPCNRWKKTKTRAAEEMFNYSSMSQFRLHGLSTFENAVESFIVIDEDSKVAHEPSIEFVEVKVNGQEVRASYGTNFWERFDCELQAWKEKLQFKNEYLERERMLSNNRSERFF